MPATEKITPRFVQVRNPRTDRYTKIDRELGRILESKKSPGPYKNVAFARRKRLTRK